VVRSTLVTIAKAIAQNPAFIGVVAGFWHILRVAGVGILVSGLAAVVVYPVGYTRLEPDVDATSQEAEEPGDTE
jgi:hypothetical protein